MPPSRNKYIYIYIYIYIYHLGFDAASTLPQARPSALSQSRGPAFRFRSVRCCFGLDVPSLAWRLKPSPHPQSKPRNVMRGTREPRGDSGAPTHTDCLELGPPNPALRRHAKDASELRWRADADIMHDLFCSGILTQAVGRRRKTKITSRPFRTGRCAWFSPRRSCCWRPSRAFTIHPGGESPHKHKQLENELFVQA